MRLSLFAVSCALMISPALRADAPQTSEEGKACLTCHSDSTPGIVEQWQSSAHARKGVDCYYCHKANEGDPATFDHYGHKIAVIVTPSYCARCHAAEVKQAEKSHHAAAAQFIGSLDNMLGESSKEARRPITGAASVTAAS